MILFSCRKLHKTTKTTENGTPAQVKEAIYIRLHPNNINMDSGIEIPEAWMTTIKKHNNRRAAKKRTAERTTHWNSEDRNTPIAAVENQPITAEHSTLQA